MLFETPADTYNLYRRYLKKEDFKRAYRCLEKLLHQFPDDVEFLEAIVNLSAYSWNNPERARPWLVKLAKIRSEWVDYILLSRTEAELGHIEKAEEHLNKAKELQKIQEIGKSRQKSKKILSDTEEFIQYKGRHKEWKALSKEEEKIPEPPQLKKEVEKKEEEKPEPIVIPTYTIPIKFSPLSEKSFQLFQENPVTTLRDCHLLIDYTHLTIQSSFNELLCLNATSGVEKYWYQIETVKKVLKYFHGRVLLGDEVGLGKTIEAGMLIKEYLMRGIVKNVLILTPTSLVSQWKEEMEVKFGIKFLTTDDSEFVRDSVNFWKEKFIIASINTAKSNKHMPTVIEQFYDLVVVDEAHHLKNRKTLSWELVNKIKKKFIFLLTATPVQNNLMELYNLITLLKPGQFKTERLFKKEYVKRGNLRTPLNKEKLRDILRDVMIRNTRSVIDLKLPKRFAQTLRLEPTELEKEIYTRLNRYLKKNNLKTLMTNLLLRQGGSSLFALRDNISQLDGDAEDLVNAINSLEDICKGKALIEIFKKNADEKKVIFTQFIKSMDYITGLLDRHGITYTTFRGDMPPGKKDEAIRRFREDIPVLVSTESGGEGRNMQFCNTIINFDLPWNPMRIEQRIGRLHRIGQTRDVFIFNLSIKETIEDYIIDILDNKINMFEMVIGEIEPILGYMGEDKDFEDIIMEIWAKSSNGGDLKNGFQELGKELLNAKAEYLKSKTLDNEVFGDNLEV